MIQYIKFGFLIALSAFMMSCSRHISEVVGEKLSKKKDTELLSVLDSLSSIQYTHFYSKVSTSFKDSSQNVSFKTSVRIVKDSAVNVLVTFAKIPMMNALVTLDSVQMFDKREKCYVKESLSYIKKNFSVEFSYKNVEELLFGMPVGYVPGEKYYQMNDPYSYTMSSHSKREIKKNERKEEREIITFYTLTEDLKNLKIMKIESPEDSTLITINYLTRELVDGYMVPGLVDIEIQTPKQLIEIDLEYNKPRVNELEPIYFVIPDSYEKCK